jgi:hypothetical protein
MAGVALKFCMGGANFKVERERRRKNKNGLRRQTGGALPTHVHHRIEGVENFQTLPWKTIFGVLMERVWGCPHDCTCAPEGFFKIILNIW